MEYGYDEPGVLMLEMRRSGACENRVHISSEPNNDWTGERRISFPTDLMTDGTSPTISTAGSPEEKPEL